TRTFGAAGRINGAGILPQETNHDEKTRSARRRPDRADALDRPEQPAGRSGEPAGRRSGRALQRPGRGQGQEGRPQGAPQGTPRGAPREAPGEAPGEEGPISPSLFRTSKGGSKGPPFLIFS